MRRGGGKEEKEKDSSSTTHNEKGEDIRRKTERETEKCQIRFLCLSLKLLWEKGGFRINAPVQNATPSRPCIYRKHGISKEGKPHHGRVLMVSLLLYRIYTVAGWYCT